MQLQPKQRNPDPAVPSDDQDPDARFVDEPVALAAGTRVLDREGCLAVLGEQVWGVLSVVELTSARPYGVPVAYAFDGEAVYVAVKRGRKLRALEQNPTLCLTVTEVESFERWRSVVVIGTARWLMDAGPRARAIRAFIGQRRPRGGALSATAATRLVASRMLRIEVAELSGRAADTEPDAGRSIDPATGEAAAGARVPAGAVVVLSDAADASALITADAQARREANVAMDALRRIVRALRSSNASMLEQYQLSAAQLFVLTQLALQPKQSLADVARGTLTSQSSVSEVLSRLVQRGLVDRTSSPTDRRRVDFSVTENGLRQLEHAPETLQQRLVAGFQMLTPDRRRALAEGLDAWMASAGLRQIPATMFMEEGSDTR